MQAFRRIGSGDVLKGGDSRQVGGEFLFSTKTPVAEGRSSGSADVEVTWCHRMRNTRDHSSVADIRAALGISDGGKGEEA